MSGVIRLVILILFLLAVIQCDKPENPLHAREGWSDSLKLTKTDQRRVTELETTMHRMVSTDPDSAIRLIHNIIHIYDSVGWYSKVFDSWVFLSEIYLYNKPDNYEALYCYAQAIDVVLKYNGHFTGSPFFLIDLGNILYKRNLFLQAMSHYRASREIATYQNDNYALAVADNNIGLCWQQLRKPDSAARCFHNALHFRKMMMPLLVAQNYHYLSQLWLEYDFPDSCRYYSTLASDAMAKQLYRAGSIIGMEPDDALILKNKLTVDLHYTHAQWLGMSVSPSPDSIVKHYTMASHFGRVTGNYKTSLKAYQALEVIMNARANPTFAIRYADTALKVAVLTGNPADELAQIRNMASLLQSSGRRDDAIKYYQLALGIADSMIRLETDGQSISYKMTLLTSQTEMAIKQLKTHQRYHESVIRGQRWGLVSLFVFIVLLAALMIVLILQRKKLLHAYQILVNRAVEIADRDREAGQSRNSSVNAKMHTQFMTSLDILMNHDKLFTQPDISLSDLSTELGTNERYLSQFINQQYRENFNDYINQLRIKESCRIIASGETSRFSLDQVAMKVGFRSRSTFYSAFKKFTGITPAYFVKNHPAIGTEANESLSEKS